MNMSQVRLSQDCVLLLNKTDFLSGFHWVITPVDVIEAIVTRRNEHEIMQHHTQNHLPLIS